MSDQVQLEWLLLRCQQGDVDELSPGLLASVDNHHPESAAILEALAAVYMRQTRYPEALHCLDRWVELAPDSVRTLDWRGWVHNQLDNRVQAVSDYERALELQPGLSAVRLRLAQILIENARYGDAVVHLDRLRGAADQPGGADGPGACWMAQSRTDDARNLLDSVLASHPDDFDALVQRGKLEMDGGHFAEAEHWLKKALEQIAPRPGSALLAVPEPPGAGRSTKGSRGGAGSVAGGPSDAGSADAPGAYRADRQAQRRGPRGGSRGAVPETGRRPAGPLLAEPRPVDRPPPRRQPSGTHRVLRTNQQPGQGGGTATQLSKREGR